MNLASNGVDKYSAANSQVKLLSFRDLLYLTKVFPSISRKKCGTSKNKLLPLIIRTSVGKIE